MTLSYRIFGSDFWCSAACSAWIAPASPNHPLSSSHPHCRPPLFYICAAEKDKLKKARLRQLLCPPQNNIHPVIDWSLEQINLSGRSLWRLSLRNSSFSLKSENCPPVKGVSTIVLWNRFMVLDWGREKQRAWTTCGSSWLYFKTAPEWLFKKNPFLAEFQEFSITVTEVSLTRLSISINPA